MECKKERTLLVNKYPNISIFLKSERNKKIKLEEESNSTKQLGFFNCPKCLFEWNRRLSTWQTYACCPVCGYDGTVGSEKRNIKIVEQFGIILLKKALPDIEKYWDFEKNINTTLNSISHASNKKVWLKCSKGHSFSRTAYHLTSNNKVKIECPRCTKRNSKVVKGINDLFTICSQAKDMWDYEKNSSLDPYKLSSTSRIKVAFKCKNDHFFNKQVRSFCKKPECTECNYTKNHSISHCSPEMLKFWDFEKMLFSPSEINPYSSKIGSWKCPKCGYAWEQSFKRRIAAKKNCCPNCDRGNLVSNGKNNLQEFRRKNPEASKYWLQNSNKGLTPDNVSSNSKRKILMYCPNNDKHIFEMNVCKIPTKAPFGCPFCFPSTTKKATFFSNCQKGKEMWDWSLNEDLNPYSLRPYSKNKAHFICSESHSFSKTIENFTRAPNCPICRKSKKRTVSQFSFLLDQWDFEKNKDFNSDNISAFSKRQVWWVCKKCKYEWKAQIASRKNSMGMCPCCEMKVVVVPGRTDLFSIVPKLMRYYDLKKNNETIITELSLATTCPLWWLCPDCDYSWKAAPRNRVEKENEKFLVKDCPACAGFRRNRSYSNEFPDLSQKFSKQLNDCSLSDITSSSKVKEKYWWVCDSCYENFETSLENMIRARTSKFKGCAYCAGKKIKKEKSFAVLHPLKIKEFSSENTVNPYAVAEKSNISVRWICSENPLHSWYAPFYQRAIGLGNCPECRNYHYGKMFSKEHPEFEKYFDKEKNKRSFDSLTKKSNERIWWMCDKGHSFQRLLFRYSDKKQFDCPICDNTWILKGVNTLIDTKPKLVSEWSSRNNREIECFSQKSSFRAYWICPNCKGEYTAAIRDREVNDESCPYCSNKLPLEGFNTIEAIKPELLNEWSTRNEKKINDFTHKSSHLAYWNCPDCKGEYACSIKKREKGDSNCPYCKNKKPLVGLNTILDIKPDLVSEWSINNTKDLSDFTFASAYRALWKCPTCHGEYSASIHTRKRGDASCPFCTNRKPLAGLNTIVDVKPELINEWSSNNCRTPHDYTYTSSNFVLWQCSKCNGEYSYRIKDREYEDKSCPYCLSKKVQSGFNSFSVKYPELMKTWDVINNYLLINPDEILESCTEKVWWKCKNNPKHRFIMSPKQRVRFACRNLEPCINCRGLRRKKRHFI